MKKITAAQSQEELPDIFQVTAAIRFLIVLLTISLLTLKEVQLEGLQVLQMSIFQTVRQLLILKLIWILMRIVISKMDIT